MASATWPTNAQRDPELEQRLTAQLSGCCFGGVLQAFACVDSTMDIAHTLGASGAGEGTLVWAARQDRGRGRLGRSWDSPEGGAYFSLILRPMRPIEQVSQLSLVAGLATAEAIRHLTGLFAAIRWPNDLLLNGRKLAGILTEARSTTSKERYVVVGIGVNVTTHPTDLPPEATSLTAAGARGVDPYRVTAEWCRHFDGWYDVWTAKGFAPIRDALRPWMSMFGQPSSLTTGTQRFEGTVQDIDEQGRLVVRLDSGILRSFEVGEVSLLR